MTSRDSQASYYDLELPDGTRTEVWAVLRAVLTPEQALGYARGCLLTRVMRDGRKPDVDRLREAEKVGIEAGMFFEAMEAHLAALEPVADELDAVDSHDPRECEERASSLAMERDDAWQEMERGKERIADLERQLDRAVRDLEDEQVTHAKLRALHAATVRELEEYRASYQNVLRSKGDASSAMLGELERERERTTALRAELTSLGETYDAEMEFRAKMRRELGADDSEGFDQFLRRVHRELVDLRDRYRPRRQSEEPAPEGAPLLRWSDIVQAWVRCKAGEQHDGIVWTHQPPAPGEGE